MTSYVDASALLRILLREPGPRCPSWPRREAFSSQIAAVELMRSLERARLAGRLASAEWTRKSREADELLETLSSVPLVEDVLALARRPFGVPVRALDAVHVASAEFVRERLGTRVEFWTHDALQARAASARSLAVRGLAP